MNIYLKDDQNEKVGIGHSQELLQEIEWEECDDVILGSHYFVGLENRYIVTERMWNYGYLYYTRI